MWTLYIIPKPTARSAVARVSPGEGTNSARLFTPWESETLAKSKVYQLSRGCMGHQPRVVIFTDLRNIWLFARCGISKISIFKNMHLENYASHNEL